MTFFFLISREQGHWFQKRFDVFGQALNSRVEMLNERQDLMNDRNI